MSLFSFTGKRPDNLGVKDGKFLACPSSPNCVNSQGDPSDQEHFIAPIANGGSSSAAIAKLKTIVEGMERSTIIEATDTYLWALFTSKIMGFGDDLEFYAEPSSDVIHVRCAARLGRSDLGANRKRVDAIREKFQASV